MAISTEALLPAGTARPSRRFVDEPPPGVRQQPSDESIDELLADARSEGEKRTRRQAQRLVGDYRAG